MRTRAAQGILLATLLLGAAARAADDIPAQIRAAQREIQASLVLLDAKIRLLEYVDRNVTNIVTARARAHADLASLTEAVERADWNAAVSRLPAAAQSAGIALSTANEASRRFGSAAPWSEQLPYIDAVASASLDLIQRKLESLTLRGLPSRAADLAARRARARLEDLRHAVENNDRGRANRSMELLIDELDGAFREVNAAHPAAPH